MSDPYIWQPKYQKPFNSLANDKIFDHSYLKNSADNKINVTGKLNFVLGRMENNVVNGENAGHQHFLLSPQCFQSLHSQGR